MKKDINYWREIEEKYGHMGDRVRYRICGKVYLHLGSHIWHTHKITTNEYRDEFEILHSFPLCVEEISERHSTRTKKMRASGRIVTPEKFYVSTRNRGIEITPGARKVLRDKNINRKMSEESKKKISSFAKNRSPELRQKMGQGISKYFEKIAIYMKCDNCGKDVRTKKSRLKKKYIFCDWKCFSEYTRNPENNWLNHIKTES